MIKSKIYRLLVSHHIDEILISRPIAVNLKSTVFACIEKGIIWQITIIWNKINNCFILNPVSSIVVGSKCPGPLQIKRNNFFILTCKRKASVAVEAEFVVIDRERFLHTGFFQRFPVCIVTVQSTGAERPDQARGCLGRASLGRRHDLQGRNWRSGTANDDGSTCAGRTFPMAGVVCRRSVPCPSHAYAVSAGGSRRPLIRPSTPAKTSRGSAASANWKTA